ncbi:hypothetical protein JR316_0012650 [Psilocybe cubensis]|uniref:BTB domain-containing protein n=2 Tax=Psilocybe cubensis TaxID=181762 RepID=A0A8H8CFP8_PSICU|nr:hypothetical protein JR316_0012650 [Psilocybe cubensis]KAH9475535.1 hypothetical protein JR316_0012650 [Psilocybe cubensis]
MTAPSLSTVRTITSSLNVLHIRADDTVCPTYHNAFSDPDADAVLRSYQGTLYRVHSYTLRTTSGLFETMFTLPQPNSRHSSDCEEPSMSKINLPSVLDVYESDFVLERLLRLLTGLPLPRWNSIEEIERVLTVAEKWDTPGPISTMRYALSSHQFLQSHPLKCYMLATHFGWDAEAKLASTHTLTLNLNDKIHSSVIDQMTSKDLLPLLDLHRKRRDMFRELLNSPERFAAGNSSPYHCNRCGVTELDNYAWRAFKHAMFLEIERRPLGDTLGLASGEAAEWPESLACWQAKCPKGGCGGLNYDRIATLRQIRLCISLLPTTIET